MQSILAIELQRVKDTGGERKIWRKTVAPTPAAAAAPAPAAPPQPAPAPLPTPSALDAATAALRAAGQPVRLFGESELQRWARAGLPYEEPSSGSRKRQRQEEAGEGSSSSSSSRPAGEEAASLQPPSEPPRVRFEEVAVAEGLEAGAGGSGAAAGGKEAAAAAPDPGGASSSSSSSSAAAVSARKRSHLDALPFAPHQPTSDAHRYLYKFWHGLLCEWEAALAARAPAHAASALGRAETQSAAQTRDFMAPFFRLCQNRTVPPDMLPLCGEFVEHLLAREYMAAGDAYLRLAVGKAQWLMGVSQVGLHERAARERIYIGKLPHVMNDETQRRYLTAMKKLMSILQDMRPPEDASKVYRP